ncbi:DUF2019 domain-containing protein [Kribbella catacumbae]|uniref:DUF2019 domain-containing protein n=1 Tax=Kribbella catacumbae TaxID=460086 RepID=UPI00035CB5C7|nr:DUF2019 domain-containing protein [Kribbella catacumbae]
MTATPGGDEVAALVERYRLLAEEWDEKQGDAKRANRVFDQHHEVAKQLRDIEGGRLGIQALLTHPVIGVRLLAATDTLRWAPEAAVPVLEQIQSVRDLHAISAEYTLKAFREGKLNLDW